VRVARPIIIAIAARRRARTPEKFHTGEPLMDLYLSGKTALVTGASTIGCGRAIATALAREGVAVAIAARRVEALEKLAAEIKAAGYIEPVVLAGDLQDPDTPKRLAAEARSRLGHVDILVSAAGGRREVPLDGPREKWD